MAVQILKLKGKQSTQLELDKRALRSVLDKVGSLPVIVISIAGEYRTGKSFILNFLLRYLQARANGSTSTWLRDKNLPLKGFQWAPGSQRTTLGIFLWSKPFIITLENGRKAGVLLVDTQGLFDDKTTPEYSATLFAFSTLISSIQVYNVMRHIGEDHLKYLESYTEYGRMIIDECFGKRTNTPFKRLVFLVRDWTDPERYRYGKDGGSGYIHHKLTEQNVLTFFAYKKYSEKTGRQVSSSQPMPLRRVRENIKGSFHHLECFLMPTPGLKASENYISDSEDDDLPEDFSGKLTELESRFVRRLDELMEFLMDQELARIRLETSINITGHDLFELVTKLIPYFGSANLPRPGLTAEELIHSYNSSLVNEAQEQFRRSSNQNVQTHPRIDSSEYQAKLDADAECVAKFFQRKVRGNVVEAEQSTKELKRALNSLIRKQVSFFENELLKQRENDMRLCRESVTECIKIYEEAMGKITLSQATPERMLARHHKQCLHDAVIAFQEQTRDSPVNKRPFLRELEEKILQLFDKVKHDNNLIRLREERERETRQSNLSTNINLGAGPIGSMVFQEGNYLRLIMNDRPSNLFAGTYAAAWFRSNMAFQGEMDERWIKELMLAMYLQEED